MDASPLERKKGKLRYYAMCSMVDWQFGRIIQRLEEMGELDNTIFMFTSDHGDMLGDRVTFSKYSMYEGSIRVPMILAGGKAKEGKIDDRYVELVDVLPTLLDAANIDPVLELPGGSLYGEPVRIGGFSEMHGSGYEGIEKAQTLMWRKKDFKLIVHTKGDAINSTKQINECACELYDLKHDPKEYKNLYRDEEYRDIVHKMTMELLLHITSITAKWPRKPSGNDFK